MTTRVSFNLKKGIFLLIVFIVLFAYSALAQSFKHMKRSKTRYSGFENSIGVRSYNMKSNLSIIDGLNVLTEGGNIGIIAGSKIFKTRVVTGWYYSSGSVGQTVDAFELDLSNNYYPIANLRSKRKLSPYLTSGLVYNKLKLSGGYLSADAGRYNLSAASSDEYRGKMHQINYAAGLGLEYKIMDRYSFVHLFIESRYNLPIYLSTNNAALNETKTTGQILMNFGVRFGAVR